MIDKFQKLFGPNPPRGGAVRASSPLEDLDLGAEDEKHRKQIARVKNKRRLIGLLAIVAAVAVVAPALFEPNEMYSQRGAKLEIPSLQDNTAAKVVPLNRKEKPAQSLPPDVTTTEPSAARSLKSDNPVKAGAKSITTPEQKSAEAADAAKSAEKLAEPPKVATKPEKGKGQVTKAEQASKSASGPLRAVTNGRYFIQVVATSKKESAEKVAADLRKLGLPTYTEIVRRRGSDLWRVRVGRFATEDDAKRALDILALNAISNGGVHTESK